MYGLQDLHDEVNQRLKLLRKVVATSQEHGCELFGRIKELERIERDVRKVLEAEDPESCEEVV